MALYRMNEAAFEVPGLIVDRTVHRLHAAARPVRLSVTRGELPEDRTLDDVVDENERKAALYLRSHRVIARRRLEVDGAAAVDVAATWIGAEGDVYTRQAHLAVGDTWMVVAVNAPAEERDACDALLEHALRSLELHDSRGRAAP